MLKTLNFSNSAMIHYVMKITKQNKLSAFSFVNFKIPKKSQVFSFLPQKDQTNLTPSYNVEFPQKSEKKEKKSFLFYSNVQIRGSLQGK